MTLLAAVIGALTIQAPTGAGPVPAPPSLIDNATLTVSRVHVAPGGALVLPRTMPPLLVVFLDEGEAQIAQGNENGRARHPSGSVTFVPKDGSYEAGNKGARPFDLLVVAIKTMRPAAPAAPATEAPPGITRTTLVDNGDVRVVRVRFAPGSREPVHTHPNDLLTVQLTPGEFVMQVGTDQQTGQQGTGFAKFLPRDVPHAYINASQQTLELLSVSIK